MPPFQRSEKVLHNFVQGRNKGLCVSLSRTKAEILLPNMRCIKGELISPFLNLTFLSRNRYANFHSLSTTHSGFIINSDGISSISIARTFVNFVTHILAYKGQRVNLSKYGLMCIDYPIHVPYSNKVKQRIAMKTSILFQNCSFTIIWSLWCPLALQNHLDLSQFCFSRSCRARKCPL